MPEAGHCCWCMELSAIVCDLSDSFRRIYQRDTTIILSSLYGWNSLCSRFLYVWRNNVPDVGDRKNFGLIRVSGTTGQVCFCALFPGQFALCTNVLCFRSGIKFRDFFRQAFSTCKYSGFSCQDWNSWSGSIPFLPIQMCLSVHCISYARVFQLPIYDGRPLSRMSWIIFFGICGIKRFLSGNLSCLSFYTVLSSLSPLFYGQSHVSPRHFALSLLVDNGADHLKPDNIFCAST